MLCSLRKVSVTMVLLFHFSLQCYFFISLVNLIQKQLSIGVLIKRCPENMQRIYRRTPMPKCDFNRVALQLYKNTYEGLLLLITLTKSMHLKNLSMFHARFVNLQALITAQKRKLFIQNFVSNCDQFCWNLRIWSYLLKKSSMENFIFCAVNQSYHQLPSIILTSISCKIFHILALVGYGQLK